MKQVLQSYRTGELWLADVPAPALRSGGLVVATHHSVVSAGTEKMIIELAKKSLIGKARARPDLVRQVLDKIRAEGFTTTMSKVFAKLDTPLPLGYSAAGVVQEAGAAAANWRAGDRVACAGAGYASHAEFNYIPRNLCVKVPDGVSLDDAAFTTLGSIAMQGVRQADLRLGERVVVIGLGLLGLLTVQMLKASGCAVLGNDLDPQRCALAKELGADEAVSADLSEAAAAFSEGHGPDAVVITAAAKSNAPIELAAEIARMKGRIVVVGAVPMDLPRDPFYKKELDLRLSMSYGPGRYDPQYEEGGQDYPFAYVRWTEQRNMASFLDLVAQGRVTPSRLVTHRYPIDDALRAYEMLEGKTDPPEKFLGILLDYPDAAAKATQAPARRIELRTASPAQPAGGAIGIGFIGAGNFARSVLIPALKRHDRAQLVGICTATGMSASQTGEKQGFEYAATDYQQLLADDRIQAVFVATQHNSHAHFATAALKAGKHVFVEKPLCIDEEQLANVEETLGEMTGEHSPCLMVGFNRRFSPHAEALRKGFADRSTPLVINYRINAGVIPADVWIQDPKVGGGRIIGEVCHFLDFCEAIVGSPAQRVFAACIDSNDSRIVPHDSLAVTLNYADGSMATIQYLAHGSRSVAKERIETCADDITAITDDFRSTQFFGSSQRTVKGKQDKGFDAEVRAFLRTVDSGGDWPIPLDSLLRTTRLTFAIHQSLRSGAPVPTE